MTVNPLIAAIDRSWHIGLRMYQTARVYQQAERHVTLMSRQRARRGEPDVTIDEYNALLRSIADEMFGTSTDRV